jgi:hypothetical protein
MLIIPATREAEAGNQPRQSYQDPISKKKPQKNGLGMKLSGKGLGFNLSTAEKILGWSGDRET